MNEDENVNNNSQNKAKLPINTRFEVNVALLIGGFTLFIIYPDGRRERLASSAFCEKGRRNFSAQGKYFKILKKISKALVFLKRIVYNVFSFDGRICL